jgi:heme-degrading monooxygenase HmoA
MSIITEIVTFKSSGEIPKEDFISIVDELEKRFHSQQPGFIDTELLFDENVEEWIILQHWDSRDNQKSASAKIFKSEAAERFIRAVIPASVKMRILPQIMVWER